MLEAPENDALVVSLNDKINAEKQKARDNLRKLMEAKKEAKEAVSARDALAARLNEALAARDAAPAADADVTRRLLERELEVESLSLSLAALSAERGIEEQLASYEAHIALLMAQNDALRDRAGVSADDLVPVVIAARHQSGGGGGAAAG
mmetsp:Transcript_12780/g.40527  ORF Transcript_12780/g.40527 Transcript_12780/m.40527 type:complete len:150 (+) Transcript_12780:28-477(+)